MEPFSADSCHCRLSPHRDRSMAHMLPSLMIGANHRRIRPQFVEHSRSNLTMSEFIIAIALLAQGAPHVVACGVNCTRCCATSLKRFSQHIVQSCSDDGRTIPLPLARFYAGFPPTTVDVAILSSAALPVKAFGVQVSSSSRWGPRRRLGRVQLDVMKRVQVTVYVQFDVIRRVLMAVPADADFCSRLGLLSSSTRNVRPSGVTVGTSLSPALKKNAASVADGDYGPQDTSQTSALLSITRQSSSKRAAVLNRKLPPETAAQRPTIHLSHCCQLNWVSRSRV